MRTVVSVFALCAACSDSPSEHDLAALDLSAAPDLAVPDMAMPDLRRIDLAMPDLTMPDLTLPEPGDAGLESGFVAAGKYFALPYAFYAIAGDVPMTSYWVMLSDKPCGATGPTVLTVHAYPYSIKGMVQSFGMPSEPAALDGPSGPGPTMSGTLALDADVVQLPLDGTAKAKAALLGDITGTLIVNVPQPSGSTIAVGTSFVASHCTIQDNL